MRVFVTGATGFVGSAVVADLIGAGHEVVGLARSDAAAEALIAAGAMVHRGALDDLESLRSGAADADGVIHTAFIHDFSKFAENGAIDKRAIEAMGAALASSNRPFVVTSGTALLSPGKLADETVIPPANEAIPRVSEQAAMPFVEHGVRVSVVRLPPTVHGDGDHGFVPALIGIARQQGAAAYLDEGRNLWPAVHRLDAAPVFRLALEHGAAGSRFHAVAEQGIEFRDIATIIGQRLGLPVVSKPASEAAAHFGWFAHFAAIDCPATSTITRQTLNWHPNHKGLIADLTEGTYF